MTGRSDLPDAVRLPIDGTLDLHAFRPQDAAAVVEDYLEEAVRLGLPSVRIVHGKGTGALRRTVRKVLERRTDLVAHVSGGGGAAGSWGATIAHLHRGSGAG